jgi:hypothetical protein
MRHGSPAAVSVALLAEGVPTCSLGSRLVSPSGLPDRCASADGAAWGGAVALPPVAAGADADLLPAVGTVEDPVTLFDRRGGRGPWTSAARESILTPALLQSRVTETRRPSEPWGLRFFVGLRARFYPMELPRANCGPSPEPHPSGEPSTPGSPEPPPAPPTAPFPLALNCANSQLSADSQRR